MRKPQPEALVVVPEGHPNPPEKHEITAAHLVANYFGGRVEFIIPLDDYKRKTPDILVNGIIMEIKSPTGNSRSTVRNQFDRASSQHAASLVFDGQRTKLDDKTLVKHIKRELLMRHRIKRVIFISKSQEVIEINK